MFIICRDDMFICPLFMGVFTLLFPQQRHIFRTIITIQSAVQSFEVIMG